MAEIISPSPSFPYSDPFLFPQGLKQDSSLKWQLDNSEVIEEIEHFLKGEVFDKKTGEWKQITEPLMNDSGIVAFISFLRARTNKSELLTTKNEDEIREELLQTANTLIEWIVMNYDNYEISEKNKSLILDVGFFFILSSVKRSLDGFESKKITTTHRILERISETAMEKPKEKEGWLKEIFKGGV